LTRYVLSQAGIPLSQVNFVTVGTSGNRAQAVAAGRIDAAAVFLTTWHALQVEGANVNLLANLGHYAPDILKGVYYARTSWVRENPDLVKEVIRAHLDANRFFHSRRSQWIDLALEFDVGASRAAVERLYDDLKAMDMFPLDGGVASVLSGA